MFDSLTAAALADELARVAQGGRIQQVGHVDRDTIWFEIYAHRHRHYLIASANHRMPAVYLTETEPVWDRQFVSPLLLLLRKYVRGGRLISIQNPVLERVLMLTIAQRHQSTRNEAETAPVHSMALPDEADDLDEDDADDEVVDDRVYTTLAIEIMGRHSNLILINDSGMIMESVRRVTPAMSRVRPISPRTLYTPPPIQIKDDPRRATEVAMAELLGRASNSKVLVQAMTSAFRGLSPQIAREAIFRANGDIWPPDPRQTASELRQLYEPLITNTWSPHVYTDGDGVVVAYAPQPAMHLAAVLAESPALSVSAAIAALERIATEGGSGRHAVRARRLASQIDAADARLEARQGSLEQETRRHANRDQLRLWGELLYGYLWQIKPGDTELIVEDQTIPLEPHVDPREQARRYLEEYRDGKNSDSQISEARGRIELERSWLENLRHLVLQAGTIQEIEDLEAEWAAHSGSQSKPPKRSSPPRRTLPLTTVNGNQIYVGRSSRENDRITFDLARPDDSWLHARGVPGSHVIVRWLGTPSGDQETLNRATQLAAWYSGSRTSARVEVDITNRQHVRKIKGAGPGMVTYRNEYTVAVAPSDLV